MGLLLVLGAPDSTAGLLDLTREEQGGAPFSQRLAVAALREMG